MSFLSSLFGGDGVLRLGLPAREHALGLTWMRVSGSLPESSDLADAAIAWIEEHVEPPFRARLRRAVTEDALDIEVVPRRQAPDPPLEALRKFSGEDWEARFAAATHVAAVRSVADPSWPPVAAWLALAASAGIARETGGLVMDPAIPRFIPRAGGDERIAGDGRYLLSDHVVVSLSPERNGRGWLTTLGLSRFALPEVEVQDVPLAEGSRAAWLAQAVALRLVEASVAAPVDEDNDMRVIEMDPELALRRRDVDAARGEEGTELGFTRPVLVKLHHRKARQGLGFLTVRPADTASKADWLPEALDVLLPPAP